MGKARIKLKGQIRSYVQWPLRFSILIICFNIFMYFVNIRAGVYTSIFAVIYIGIALALYFRSRTIVFNDFISFATQYGQVQKQLLRDLDIPYALIDDTGKIIWTNEAFEESLHVKKNSQKSINSIVPGFLSPRFEENEWEKNDEIDFEGKTYRVLMKKVSVRAMMGDSDLVEEVNEDSYLNACFLFDETEVRYLRKELDDREPAVGLIYIDNYDEAMETVDQ